MGVPVPRRTVWGSLTVKLEILERFQGEANKSLVVRTEAGTEACGFPFQAGKEYLVFAEAFQGKMAVTFCSVTQPAKAAASRVKQLRALRDATPLPALFGSVVTRPAQQSEDFDEYVQPASNLTVVAESRGNQYRTQTSEHGLYEFHGIPSGEYYVQVQAPADRVALWSGGVARVRTGAGLDPRCPVDFHISNEAPLP